VKTSAPTDLKAVVTSNSASLTWLAPKEYLNNGSYRVELSFGKNKYTLVCTTIDSSYKIVALSEGKIYDFRVAAVVNGVVGDYSQVIRVIPTPSATPNPTPTQSPTAQIAEAPTNLYVIATSTPGTVRLTWGKSATSANVVKYRLEMSTQSSGWVLVGDTPGNGLAADINSLNSGVAYNFRVYAINESGVSLPSASYSYTIPISTASVPGQVSNLRASLNGTDLILAWNAPATNNGSAITAHKLQVSIDNINWINLSDGNASLAANLNGLESKRSYYFRVAAVNAVGAGAWSQAIKVTMP